MSITTELREFVDGLACHKVTRDLLCEIADRIDQEHELAVTGAMNDALYYANDENMAELGWVRLPKDADGETIHLQDRMSWDNGTFNVHELNLTADGWTTWDELHGYTVRADQCHHVQPDSWESIIEDARTMEGCGSIGEFMERHGAELVERCKRLAGEVE